MKWAESVYLCAKSNTASLPYLPQPQASTSPPVSLIQGKMAMFEPSQRQSTAGVVPWSPPQINWNPWTSSNIDEGPLAFVSISPSCFSLPTAWLFLLLLSSFLFVAWLVTVDSPSFSWHVSLLPSSAHQSRSAQTFTISWPSSWSKMSTYRRYAVVETLPVISHYVNIYIFFVHIIYIVFNIHLHYI